MQLKKSRAPAECSSTPTEPAHLGGDLAMGRQEQAQRKLPWEISPFVAIHSKPAAISAFLQTINYFPTTWSRAADIQQGECKHVVLLNNKILPLQLMSVKAFDQKPISRQTDTEKKKHISPRIFPSTQGCVGEMCIQPHSQLHRFSTTVTSHCSNDCVGMGTYLNQALPHLPS